MFCSLTYLVSSFQVSATDIYNVNFSSLILSVKIRLTVWCTIDVMAYFSCQALAKELVRSRRAVNRLYENKAQLNSVSMHLGEIVGMAFFCEFFFVGLVSDVVHESVLSISGRVILLVNIQRHVLLLSWG
jgi:hypothetical protein